MNYHTIEHPDEQSYVSSATPKKLPLDCTKSAAELDIFIMLNQPIIDDLTLINLITVEHPEVKAALSDDKQQAQIYYNKLKNFLTVNTYNPINSGLNKQIFWPNHTETYLSHKTNDYRILTPLYPSSLAHLVYQKIQTRNSEDNFEARKLRNKNGEILKPYISVYDIAYVKLGGANPRNVSFLINRQSTNGQGGANLLLPSMPPKFASRRFPLISKHQKTIFNAALRYYSRYGFRLILDMIKASKNTVTERDNRKDGLEVILVLLLKYAKHIQTTMPAGWSLDYALDWTEKLWLDPKRADLDGEEEFKEDYQKGDWVKEIEAAFAFWIQSILKEKSGNRANQFSDTEFSEWKRTFSSAVKVSKRKQQGVF